MTGRCLFCEYPVICQEINFHCEGGQTMEESCREVMKSPSLEKIQNLSEFDPEEPECNFEV